MLQDGSSVLRIWTCCAAGSKHSMHKPAAYLTPRLPDSPAGLDRLAYATLHAFQLLLRAHAQACSMSTVQRLLQQCEGSKNTTGAPLPSSKPHQLNPGLADLLREGR